MAIAGKNVPAPRLTYAQYMAAPITSERYDIVDGERIDMPNPSERHQIILLNIAEILRSYERRTRRGKTLIAPRDILIHRQPLRIRQPDVLFIGNERRAQNPPATDPSPMSTAPELVVEILSPSETWRSREEKILDYQRVGVLECWIVDDTVKTVEVLRLTPDAIQSIVTYAENERLQSVVFPDLTLAVAAIFAD